MIFKSQVSILKSKIRNAKAQNLSGEKRKMRISPIGDLQVALFKLLSSKGERVLASQKSEIETKIEQMKFITRGVLRGI